MQCINVQQKIVPNKKEYSEENFLKYYTTTVLEILQSPFKSKNKNFPFIKD